jgi:hypothetical protein
MVKTAVHVMLLTEMYLLEKGWLKHRGSQMVFHPLKWLVKTAIPAMPPTEGYMLQTSMLNPEVTDGNTHQHEQ